MGDPNGKWQTAVTGKSINLTRSRCVEQDIAKDNGYQNDGIKRVDSRDRDSVSQDIKKGETRVIVQSIRYRREG